MSTFIKNSGWTLILNRYASYLWLDVDWRYSLIGSLLGWFMVYPALSQSTIGPEQITKLPSVEGHRFYTGNVAISGNILVINAEGEDINGNVDQGAVYVYTLLNRTWTKTATLTASDGKPNDYFGQSAAILGNTIVVGSPYVGAVYIYTLVNDRWVQTSRLTASDGKEAVLFGNSVAISDNVIVVGAPEANVSGKQGQGAVYVYTLTNGKWLQTARLLGSDRKELDHFGSSVALSGNTLFVGAIGVDEAGLFERGAGYIYTLNNGTWTQVSRLLGRFAKAYFGKTADIDSNTLIVGTNNNTHIYTLTGGSWVQTTLLEGQSAEGVAISDNTIVIGTPFESVNDIDGQVYKQSQGRAYVYTLTNGSWLQTAQMTASDGKENDRFGRSVAISGSTICVSNEPILARSGLQRPAYTYIYELKTFILPPPNSLSVSLNQNLTDADTAVLNLSWQDIQGETGYVLESSAGEFAIGRSITRDTLPANTSQFSLRTWRGEANPRQSLRIRAFNSQGISPYSNVATIAVGSPVPIPYRLNCGASRTVNSGRYTFAPDRYFTEESKSRYFPNSGDITGTVNDLVYQAFRSGEFFSYNIPVTNGQYRVILNFAELFFTEAHERTFSVNIEKGTAQLVDMDVFTAAGGANRALSRSFQVTVNDGVLDIDFTSLYSRAMIAVIQILPADASAREGIEEEPLAEVLPAPNLQLYPNPSDGLVTVKFAPAENRPTVEVYDLKGALLERQTDHSQSGQVILNQNRQLPAGMYVVKLRSATQIRQKKLVITR